MARGVGGMDVYRDDLDRKRFLATLGRVARQSGAQILAYCLMGNHFHLVVKVANVPLGAIMQRLLTSYAASFNVRYEREGHLFQARHRANLCLDDRYLACLIRYVHQNPVRAGIVSSPGQWPWSSHRDYARDGRDGAIGWMSDLPDLAEALPADFDPWLRPSTPGIVSRAPLVDTADIGIVVAEVSRLTGIPPEVIRSRTRRAAVAAARREVIVRAGALGIRASVIAAALGIAPSFVTRRLKS